MLSTTLIALLASCSPTPAPNTNPPISSIRVVMDNNYPPYAFMGDQGNMQGILVDQWKLWGERTGVKVEITGLPWGEALDGMEKGKFDVIDTIFYTDERAKIFDYTKPYAKIDVRIFFSNNVSGIADAESLKGFRVAVKTGDADAEYLLARGVTDLAYYGSYEEIIQAVTKKEETIFVMDQPPALYFLYKYGIQDKYNYSEPLYGGEFHRAVKKGNTAILDLVNSGFAKISKTEYQTIDDRWFGTRQNNDLNRIMPYLGIGAALAVLVISVLVIFNRTLQTRVKVRTKELEEAITELQESEALFRGSIEFLPIPISIADAQGKILMVNHKFTEHYGYSLADMETIAEWMWRAYPEPEYLEKVLIQWGNDVSEAIKNNTTTPLREYKITGKDGRQHDAEVIMRPVENLWVASFIEVTERNRAIGALRATTAKMETLIQVSPLGIILVDMNDNIQIWNLSAERIFGWSAKEIIGRHNPIVPMSEQDEDAIIKNQVFDGGSITNLETMRQRKDGMLIDVSVSSAAVYDEKGNLNGRMAIIADITERKYAEKKLDQQIEYLRSLRNIDRIITTSVDLNANLSTIVQEIVEQLNVDAAVILLLDAKTKTLNYAAGKGLRTEALKYTHLKLGDGLAGQAAQKQTIIHIPNLSEMKHNPTLQRSLTAEGFIEYYGIPLIAKDQLLGVLEIFHRSPLNPDPDWLAFLETLIGQVAISIDSATLFSDLQKSNTELELAYDATLAGWSHALDLRDKETEGHTRRVTDAAIHLAQALGLSHEEILHIKRGGLLHDIGKMGIPDSILLKAGPLTDEEWTTMRKHPIYAYEMLSPIYYLRSSMDIPYCHHEHWDGTGYPRGLKGEEIPLAARIFAVVDVWDALSFDRPYQDAWPKDKVIQYLMDEMEKRFDPKIVTLFLELLNRGEI